MSYVNMKSDVRWQEADHVSQVEAFVRSRVPHTREHVVIRRMFQMLLPLLAGMLPPAPTDGSADPYAGLREAIAQLVARCAPMTPAQFAEIMAAAATFSDADMLAEEARADSARLGMALDYERDRAELLALPQPAPTDGTEDPLPPEEREAVEERRVQLQAALDAASEDTLALVAERDAERPAPAEDLQEPAAQDPAPQEAQV